MNRDKEQNWKGYQEYSTSGNSYIISDEVAKMKFLILCLDRNLFNVVIGNRYLPRDSKMYFLKCTFYYYY